MQFTDLCSRAWNLPLLAALNAGCPARVSPLAAHLGAGRTSVGASFEHLQQLGLICRTPDHGHPLRPEFMLTEQGHSVAQWAGALSARTPIESWPSLRKTWTLPILRLLNQQQRFGELRSALSPITDRALSLSLKELSACNWAQRCVDPAQSPPQVSYSATGFGAAIQPELAQSFSIAI